MTAASHALFTLTLLLALAALKHWSERRVACVVRADAAGVLSRDV
jgi:hypothetical protein